MKWLKMPVGVNLNRCPFLSAAIEFIRDNPGCCKRDVILGVGYHVSRSGTIANRTYSNRNAALGRLIDEALVENRGHAGRYALYINK